VSGLGALVNYIAFLERDIAHISPRRQLNVC